MTHIVLVHGAWHGAWCWYRTLPALAAAGFTPHAIDLPGHGLRNGDTQSLAAYAEAVAAKLRELPEQAVVVGHSMGGAVISAAAELEPDRISTLVYLCAFPLMPGDTLMALAADDTETILPPYMQPQADGRITVADEGIHPTFYADCTDEDVALAKLLLVPQSPEPFTADPNLSEARFGRVRRTYIICDQDRAIGPAKQRWLAGRARLAAEAAMAASHSPFFSDPAGLAATIKGLL
jgi:pimeloyl-ACP methyl ester carboxylesterase